MTTGTTLDGRQIERIDDRWGGRFYKVEGIEEPLPSVTTILNVIAKPPLIPWAKKITAEKFRDELLDRIAEGVDIHVGWIDDVFQAAKKRPDEIRDEAADFGNRAHILLEELLNGEEPEIPEEMLPVFDSFNAWRNRQRLDIELSETMVYSEQYHFAGTLDALARRDGLRIAIDWKTSNRIYDEYAAQVAAYSRALNEMTGDTLVTEAWVVRFGKQEAEFEAKACNPFGAAWEMFEGALRLWQAKRSKAIWLPPDYKADADDLPW